MKNKVSIVIALISCISAASHADSPAIGFDAGKSLNPADVLSSAVSNVEVPRVQGALIDKLKQAVLLRQSVRDFLVQHGQRITKEVLAESHGDLKGDIFGWGFLGIGTVSGSAGGHFDQKVYENLLKGGELFALNGGLSPETQQFTAALGGLSVPGECPKGVLAKLQSIQAAQGRQIEELGADLAKFRSAMNALEVDFVGNEASPQYATFQELKRWGQNTAVRIGSLQVNSHELLNGAEHRFLPTQHGGIRFFSSISRDENYLCVNSNAGEAIRHGFRIVERELQVY